jgi:hypothetical protein
VSAYRAAGLWTTQTHTTATPHDGTHLRAGRMAQSILWSWLLDELIELRDYFAWFYLGRKTEFSVSGKSFNLYTP